MDIEFVDVLCIICHEPIEKPAEAKVVPEPNGIAHAEKCYQLWLDSRPKTYGRHAYGLRR